MQSAEEGPELEPSGDEDPFGIEGGEFADTL